MTTPYEAAEVRAARAGKAPRPAGAEVIPVHAPVGPDLDVLLHEMIDADEVFIVGLLPWECSRRLIELQQDRLAGVGAHRPKTVHYFIPERDAKNTGATMGPSIQRWIAGLFGVRNWVTPRRDDDANPDTLVIHLYQDDTGGRVVLTRTGDTFQATTLLYLPLPRLSGDGVLTVAAFDTAQTEKIRAEVLGKLLPESRQWAIRQVRCYGPKYEDSGDSNAFTPRVQRITTNRKIQPKETEPAVVIAVCGMSFQGPVVVLKRRHQSNSIDDFGVLSLISEHVIVEDLVAWLRRVPQPLDADDDRAVDQLWKAAGRPKRLILEPQFFAEAAQRELFLSCGLNIDFDRLDFCGYRLVNREDDTHLGFAVFRLDLLQNDTTDELDIVTQWSPDMVSVPISKLYDGTFPLNRLLRLQERWLMSNVFSKPPGPASADPSAGQD